MGRARKPANLKRGNSESKEELKVRAAAEQDLMTGVEKLKKRPSKMDDKVYTIYKKLVSELIDMNIVTNIDEYSLRMLAQSIYFYNEATQEVMNSGQVIEQEQTNGSIKLVKSPWLEAQRQHSDSMNKIMSEYGFTPQSRAKLAGDLINNKKTENESVDLNSIMKELRDEWGVDNEDD